MMEHFYEDIEGWFKFADTYSEMVELSPNPAHFVEVGCWKGKSTSYMAVEIANSGKDIRFDCVDTWRGDKFTGVFETDELYDEFIKNMNPVVEYYNPYRMTSIEAAENYADESLDFVFLDASHDYESVMQDIVAWYPKVKVGGYIGGDDYWPTLPGVIRAVDEFFGDDKRTVTPTCLSTWLHKKKEK